MGHSCSSAVAGNGLSWLPSFPPSMKGTPHHSAAPPQEHEGKEPLPGYPPTAYSCWRAWRYGPREVMALLAILSSAAHPRRHRRAAPRPSPPEKGRKKKSWLKAPGTCTDVGFSGPPGLVEPALRREVLVGPAGERPPGSHGTGTCSLQKRQREGWAQGRLTAEARHLEGSTAHTLLTSSS